MAKVGVSELSQRLASGAVAAGKARQCPGCRCHVKMGTPQNGDPGSLYSREYRDPGPHFPGNIGTRVPIFPEAASVEQQLPISSRPSSFSFSIVSALRNSI